MNAKTNELKQIEILNNKLQLAQRLVTNERFYLYWFEQLALPENNLKTKTQVFNQVNDLYQQIFNTKKGKYSSYKSFMNAVTNKRKNTSKQ